jgi:hypothetical protein
MLAVSMLCVVFLALGVFQDFEIWRSVVVWVLAVPVFVLAVTAGFRREGLVEFLNGMPPATFAKVIVVTVVYGTPIGVLCLVGLYAPCSWCFALLVVGSACLVWFVFAMATALSKVYADDPPTFGDMS